MPASHLGSRPAIRERIRDRIVSTPRARRVAAELGVEWTRLAGTGAGGRIREADVRRAAAAPSTGSPFAGSRLSSRRRVIADRMVASQQRNAPVTLTMRADATQLVNLRNQIRSDNSQRAAPSYTDIAAALVARVLRNHRHMAGRWDAARERVLLPGSTGFAIGIAVHTDEGLVVPVVRDADLLTLDEVAARTRELIERARSGRLSAEEVQGGVFTITSLGAFGVEAFTPIINDPETAILGLGAIRKEAVVLGDGQIVPRDMITLSLTFDHVWVDGTPAARFLQDVRRALEAPFDWLAPTSRQ